MPRLQALTGDDLAHVVKAMLCEDGFVHNLGYIFDGFKSGLVYGLTIEDIDEQRQPVYKPYFFKSNGERIGNFALPCFILLHPEKPDTVDMIWVSLAARRKGFGRLMMEALGIRFVNRPLKKAQGFYDKCGVKEEGVGFLPTGRHILNLCMLLRECQLPLFQNCRLGAFVEASIQFGNGSTLRMPRFLQPRVVGPTEYDDPVDLNAPLQFNAPDLPLFQLKMNRGTTGGGFTEMETSAIRDAIARVWPDLSLSVQWYVRHGW